MQNLKKGALTTLRVVLGIVAVIVICSITPIGSIIGSALVLLVAIFAGVYTIGCVGGLVQMTVENLQAAWSKGR
jgi:hypothetical protein